MPPDPPPTPSHPGAAVLARPTSWWMRPFGEVHADELPGLLLFGANAFLMMAGYYLLKTAREPLILLGEGRLPGPELKTYATAVQALLLLVLLPAYAHVARRTRRLPLVTGTVILLLLSLLVFGLLGAADVAIGLPFYVWLGATSLISGAQFWSFANDYYTRSAGERLFPLIAVGGTLGAVAGAGTARWLMAHVGSIGLMPISAALLVGYAALFHVIERLPLHRTSTHAHATRAIGGGDVLSVLRGSRYLVLIGLMVLIANLVNTTGEFILARAVAAEAAVRVPAPANDDARQASASPAQIAPLTTTLKSERATFIGKVYGEYYSGVNLLGLLLQAFVVSRIFKHLGPSRALFVVPVIAMTAYGSVLALPAFALIATVKTVENGADYSLQNTVRQALFLPTSRAAKFQGKATVDALFMRLWDLCAAAAVFVGVHRFDFGTREFALTNLGAILAWFVVANRLARGYRRLAEQHDLDDSQPTTHRA